MRPALAVTLCLALAACGHDRPPAEFRPASRGCGSLAGDYIVSESDLRWLGATNPGPDGGTYPFLGITDAGNGTLTLVLRRRTADVLAEAATLRLAAPDRYRAWRAWVLGEPADPALWNTPGASAGPRISHTWQLSAGECDGGWRGGSAGIEITPRPGSDDAEHLAFISLARADDGALLVQHHVRRENLLDFSFRGQQSRWYSYAYSDWHRIPAAPPGTAPQALSASDLPAIPDQRQRMKLDYESSRQWGSFQAWLRAALPADARVTVFRERQFDPQALGLPPGQRRIELAGHWPPGEPDPFTPLLQGRADVSDLEVKQSRLQADNRPYLLVEFTLTAPR